MEKKLRLAVIVHGGVNSGHKGQGIPTLMTLLKELHLNVDLTVYSLAKLNTTNELSVKYVRGVGKLKYITLGLLFTKDHLIKRYDVVQAFWGFPSGVLANILSAIFSVPSVVTLMGGETASLPDINYGALKDEKGKKRVFQLVRKANIVVALSNYQIEFLKKSGFSDHSEITIIPFGVKCSGRVKELPDSEIFNIVQVANINSIKDHKTAINAVNLVSERINVHLKIVGGDFLNGKIQRYVAEKRLSDKISFTGILTNEEVFTLIEESDLVLMSSRSEGQAVVFNEAMAQGVPFCATDVGLMQDLAGECCLTSTPGDFKGLANNMIKVLTDESLYRTLSQNGIEWTINNDLNTTVSKYLEVYKKLT